MKIKHLFKLLLSTLFVASIYSCSTDRLIPAEEPVDPFKDKVFEGEYDLPILNKLASVSQKFTVKSSDDLPITTPKGTKIWLYEWNLVSPQGSEVKYPFDIEIIELYSLKDMILHRKPTESYGRLLSTGGAIYLSVSKNGNPLQVSSYPPNISIPAAVVDNDMWLFYEGYGRNDRFTWQEAPPDTANNPNQQEGRFTIFAGKGSYEIFPKRFGWINCDKFANDPRPQTTVSFVSTKVPLENVAIFMVLPNINSVIQVFNGKSLNVPIGEDVKIVAIAQTTKEEVFSFFKDIKIEDLQTIEIELKPSTEKEVLDALEKL
ncbi:hypothetical protein Emtol_2833 [Emticicia oligotrophica DSM 17448]|uniref:PKD domain-containing protein n=1 Tax=Emticicia oligotrophica (strain DSM 17448 / CIP 109782 / MTCC 6937 / GPTSA100-15) TaxID=929562 RepID=A0ABN4ANG9_EMTOG|nr:hypothetical protein [Emticicia oligotrophica]AFK03967.1 hypothetical protein Emtol_2833 [Emticicia oligotrophica DSM 17448]